MSTRKTLILIGIAVAVVVIVIVNVRLTYESSTDVEVKGVRCGTIVERVSGPGVVHAESSVKISSSVMGRITGLHVEEGDVVEEADIVLRIEASQYKARLNQAEAVYKAALASSLPKARHLFRTCWSGLPAEPTDSPISVPTRLKIRGIASFTLPPPPCE